MQIHVVKRGDTLFKIANTYGTTINQLTQANELNASNQLVIGQTLVIPIVGQFYFVQVGDSLYSIDRKSTRLNSSHVAISYAVFCLKKKNNYHLEKLLDIHT